MNVTRIITSKLISPVRTVLLRRTIQTTTNLNMSIKEGDNIPGVELFEDTPTNSVNVKECYKNKKIIIFGVPGAFTPGCSKTHLPGYLKQYDEFKCQGIDTIICVSVNDPFVMSAWGKNHDVGNKIRMLADPQAKFTKAMCLDTDIPALGGVRSMRYSMVVDKGCIKQLNVEPDGTGLSCSLADKLKV